MPSDSIVWNTLPSNKKLLKDNLVIVSPTDRLKQTTLNDIVLVELQQKIFENGQLVYNDPDILEKQRYCDEEMNKLYPEVKRCINPHEYYVDGTEEYVDFKYDLIGKVKKMTRGD